MANNGIELKGEVVEACKGGTFRVKLLDNNAEIMCTISGKLRKNYIRIIPGDMVDVSISEYDLTKGRIIWRYK